MSHWIAKSEGLALAEPKISISEGRASARLKIGTPEACPPKRNRRVRLLPDQDENRLNVGRGFTPRRKKFVGSV